LYIRFNKQVGAFGYFTWLSDKEAPEAVFQVISSAAAAYVPVALFALLKSHFVHVSQAHCLI